MNDTILLQWGGAIATVVLNNPVKLNALWMRLGEVLRELEAEALAAAAQHRRA